MSLISNVNSIVFSFIRLWYHKSMIDQKHVNLPNETVMKLLVIKSTSWKQNLTWQALHQNNTLFIYRDIVLNPNPVSWSDLILRRMIVLKYSLSTDSVLYISRWKKTTQRLQFRFWASRIYFSLFATFNSVRFLLWITLPK